jgi:hypothetical protein
MSAQLKAHFRVLEDPLSVEPRGEDLYRRLRCLDDGLPPIETTSLLAPTLWSSPPPDAL